jgi:hypothetical protein
MRGAIFFITANYTREFDVIPVIRAPYSPSIARDTRVRASKTRYFEKFKINISTSRIKTKLYTQKRLNTKSILLYSLIENDEKFRRYPTFSRYEIQNVWPSCE